MAVHQQRDRKKRSWWESWLWVTIACSGFALSALQPSVVVTDDLAPKLASVVGPVELALDRESPPEWLTQLRQFPVGVGAADHFDVDRPFTGTSFFERFERALAELRARLRPGATPPVSTTTTVPTTTTTTRPTTTTVPTTTTTTRPTSTTVPTTTTTTRPTSTTVPTTTTTTRPTSTSTTLVGPTTTTITTVVAPPTTSTTLVGPTTTTVVPPTTTTPPSTTSTTAVGPTTTTIPSTTIPSTTIPPTTTTTPASPTAVAEQRFVELINEERQAAGLSPLQVNVEIRTVARNWTAQMISDAESCRLADLNHNPDYAEEMPDGWTSVAENVGCGPTVESLHQALMNSPGHRANILAPNFTDIGVGVGFDANGTLWVTQNFGQY